MTPTSRDLLILSPRITDGSGGQTDREALSLGPGNSTVNEDFGQERAKLLGVTPRVAPRGTPSEGPALPDQADADPA